MQIDEQPGDQEDLQGRPFVGPAGQVLDRALEAAGLERAAIYVTNAVKHFKYEPRGKRRLHKSRMPARSMLASGGSTTNSAISRRASSWRSAQPRYAR